MLTGDLNCMWVKETWVLFIRHTNVQASWPLKVQGSWTWNVKFKIHSLSSWSGCNTSYILTRIHMLSIHLVLENSRKVLTWWQWAWKYEPVTYFSCAVSWNLEAREMEMDFITNWLTDSLTHWLTDWLTDWTN